MAFNDGLSTIGRYGYGQYGKNIYGVIPFAASTGIIPTEQDGFCPRYIRFQISGINLGLYIFDLNPTFYDVYPQRNTQQYNHILNHNGTIDENYSKIEIEMKWDRMPESMWEKIAPYSRKNVDGTTETTYFWDGNIGRFVEHQIKVEAFQGEVLAGMVPIDRSNVSVKLREV